MALIELAVEELVDRRLCTWSLTLLELAQDAVTRITQHFNFDHHPPELLAHDGIVQNGLTVTAQQLANLDQTLHVGLVAGHARQGVAAALEAKRRLRQLPALAFAADDVLRRHRYIGKEDLGEFRAAGDLFERPHLDTRSVHVDDEIRDALVLGNARIGPCQQDAVVGDRPQARPHLLSIDHPVVPSAHGAGLQTGQVRA